MKNVRKSIDIIDELACLAAQHKLIPFLGAGCSQPHLKCDWKTLTIEMAKHLNIDHRIGPLAVAQEFIEKAGKPAMCAYLRDRLLIDRFEDSLGTAHLAVLSLGIDLIYTTNQDNVFEQCAMKYKPQWKTVIQLEDLVDCPSGTALYIKYHGDLSYPHTVIFSEKDYGSRIEDAQNFLNIRLRSDLLAKSLLFIGYSFSDGTVRNIFTELRTAFGQKLPESYLISYKFSDELEQVCNDFGVCLVDPCQEFQAQFDPDEAFERFLTLLVEKTYRKKTETDIEELVHQKRFPQPLVTKYEMQAVKNNLTSLPFDEAVSLFRQTFDLAMIPRDFQKQVVNFVESLCSRCSNLIESDRLSDLLFLLHLDSCEGLAATSAVFSTANCRGEPSRFNSYFFPRLSHGELDYLSALVAAVAIQMLKDQGKEIGPGFKVYAANFVSQGIPVEDYPEPVQGFINEMFKEVFENDQTWQVPRRLFGNRRKYKDILQSLQNKLPRSRNLGL